MTDPLKSGWKASELQVFLGLLGSRLIENLGGVEILGDNFDEAALGSALYICLRSGLKLVREWRASQLAISRADIEAIKADYALLRRDLNKLLTCLEGKI